ncbi:MAG: hypothetical protein K0R76_1425 [Alphaproteobacteria bacterium]|jgi:hypothetical protein|nr:hypothetical protein [Alphaproteobacteria bacterium]
MPKKYAFVLLVFLGVASFSFYKVQRLLLLTDLSTLPIDARANPDYNPSSPLRRDPVYLVSYADGHEVFFQNQLALAQSALGRGVDVIVNYRRSLLDPKFIEDNKQILNEKRGAGYWLWKPWVILDTMKKAPKNAIIIYSDCGTLIKGSLAPLIDLAKQYPIILAHYEEPIYKLPQATGKREVFIQLGCDHDKCYKGLPIWAGFLIVRNVPEAQAFIEQWLFYAKDPSLLIDGPSSKPELKEFLWHQHDQSILTVLYNRDPKGKYLIPYGSELTEKYLVWKHRRPGVSDYPYFLNVSLLQYYGYLDLSRVDKYFINSSLLKWLRHKIYQNK